MSLLLPLIVSLPWDLCSCPGIVAWYKKDEVECQNKNELTSTWPFSETEFVSEREKCFSPWPGNRLCSGGEGTLTTSLQPGSRNNAVHDGSTGAGLFAVCFQTIKSDVKFGSIINLGLWFIEFFCFEREVRKQYFCFSRKH